MGGRLVFPGGGAYHATKYAVEALSDALRFEVRGFGIDVVVIEPGLITTEFGETAERQHRRGGGPGPYAEFNAAVGRRHGGRLRPLAARFGGGPETVAGRSRSARHRPPPKTRYKVTPSARMVMGMRGLMMGPGWPGSLCPLPVPAAQARGLNADQPYGPRRVRQAAAASAASSTEDSGGSPAAAP